jgi:hypothetical protein
MVMIYIIPLAIVVGILTWMLRPGKSPTTARTIALLATVIPPVVVAIPTVILQILHTAVGKTWVSDISNTGFIVGLRIIDVAILALTGFAIARKGEVAKGVGFGVCISVIVSIIEFGVMEWLGRV